MVSEVMTRQGTVKLVILPKEDGNLVGIIVPFRAIRIRTEDLIYVSPNCTTSDEVLEYLDAFCEIQQYQYTAIAPAESVRCNLNIIGA